jgi:acetyl esterase/lipase
LLAGAQAPQQTRVKDVIYGFKEGVALTMDVFKPARPNGIGVLWMVSGGWVSNHDNINAELAVPFTSRGETVFEIVHGTQPRFPVGEILKDIRRAVRYVRTNAATYGVDPNKLGISGGSSGGHLSLITAAMGDDGDPSAKDPVDRASSRLQAVACFFPPTDFMNYGKTGVRAFDVPMLSPFRPAFGLPVSASDDDKVKLAIALSPISHLTDKMPPTLIIHGDADTLVPIQQSQLFCAKLDELKVPNKLEVRPGKGHGWPEAGQDLVHFADWYDKYLGGTK